MSAVFGVVQPLAAVGTCCNVAVQVLHVDLVGGVHGLSGGALVVKTYFEFSISLDHAVWSRVVDSIIAEAKSITVFIGKSIALP